MTLLPRVRAVLPGAAWQAALPARVAPAEAPQVAEARIARRLAIELDGAGATTVVLNDESRLVDPDMVATVVRAAAAASKSTRIVFARGSHPLPAKETLAAYEERALARLGPEDLDGIEVAHHDARATDLVPVGGSSLHPWVADADRVLALGSVEPHYFAGWTGAHKTATIGVMALADIERNHARALDASSRVLALEGNPIFDEIAKVASALGPKLTCVNQVLADGRMIAWGVGPWRQALEHVVGAARTAFVREVEGAVDLLVASVEGPLGRNLYQAEKGIKNSEDAVRDEGAVVLVAPCPDGLGPSRFLDLLARAPDHRSAAEHVRSSGYVLGDHKAVKVRALEARGVRLHVVGRGLSREDRERVNRAGLATFDSLEEALLAANARSVVKRALVVEDAGNLVAQARAT